MCIPEQGPAQRQIRAFAWRCLRVPGSGEIRVSREGGASAGGGFPVYADGE